MAQTLFTTEEVKTYLLDAWPDLDGEKRIVRLRCYVNPVTPELCQEVDPEIASVLFHKLGTELRPRPTLNHCRFTSNIGPQSFKYCRDPKFEGGDKVFIPVVTITKLEAGKVTPESDAWALMFTVSFEKQDPKVLNDLSDLLHEHFYCTFGPLQAGLFDTVDPHKDALCRLCEAPNPEFQTSDKKFYYCIKCSINKQDGETLVRIRDAAKAASVVDDMRQDGREPGDEPRETTRAPRKDPLAGAIDKANAEAQGRRGRRG